ncbi:MAG: hypothetical protein JRN26_03560 [Nitrososphaerota archaeon]|jgi:hypothetical protein|nr:hypothetical protein [Nitrososphaerota archaeon]MDG6931635.1 hypothetical protein [Nitrososphaerota archaeon]MDG6935948.1 hypothetical protein [Nitrososphaerota archaeon]MDG6943998.1 hypothetical protein [Nitrososphaerota archaeon]
MIQEIDEKMNRANMLPIDLYIKKIDEDILKMATLFNFKTLVCNCAGIQTVAPPAITIYKYKYNPEKDFKGPLVKLNSENLEALADYVKSHPNKIQGIILDFNEFRDKRIDYSLLSYKLPFFQIHDIPIVFGSGASSSDQVVPSVTLRAAVKYFTPVRDPDNSKAYKKFYKNLMAILVQGKYFETH